MEVPEPPNVAVARKSIAVVAQKQDRLRQQKVWEPRPHHWPLKPHPQGTEFDKSQPGGPGGAQILRGPGRDGGVMAEMLVVGRNGDTVAGVMP